MNDRVDAVEFFTNQYRIVGTLRKRGQRLTDLLNDELASAVELRNVQVTRHLTPQDVIATHLTAILEKKGILFGIARGETEEVVERRLYKHVDTREWPVFMTVRSFELTGRFHVRGTGDLKTMLLAWTGQFIPLTQAKATFALFPEVSFSGHVMVVNRAHVEAICTDVQSVL